MKAQHTKGPWIVGMGGSIRCSYTDTDGDDIIVGGIQNNENQIGSSVYSQPNKPEGTANAHLIAAAPELLEALAWFIDDIDGTRTDMGEFDFNVERSRAAIAKAKGDS